MSVSGPIGPADLGLTLMHEHLLIDLSRVIGQDAEPSRGAASLDVGDRYDVGWSPEAFFSSANADLSDPTEAAAEVRDFATAGGGTVVELTPIGFRRDVALLRDISSASGVNVVVGSAYFSEASAPTWASRASAAELAARIVNEFEHGIDGTGVRPGIIGEVGTSSPVSSWEARSLEASVIASRTTGMAISVHLDRWEKDGLRVVDLLEEAGADLSRVVIGHLNTTLDDLDYHRALADRGVVLGYDLCGSEVPRAPGRFPPRDSELLPTLRSLILAGHGERIVLSHDLSFKTEYRRYGGRGYGHIPRRIVPLLLDDGFDPVMVQRMTHDTPARLLTLAPPS